MRVQNLRVTCAGCKTVFDAEIVVDAPISVAVASLEAIRCQVCGRSNVGLGGNYSDAPPVSAPIGERVAWWRDRGEHGISSETIFAAFAGGRPRSIDVPLDPDDFRRCRLLLDLIPEWRSDLVRVVGVYPWFGPFVSRWDEMDRLFDEEVASGTAPKLYAVMGEALEETRRLQETP